MENPKEYDTIKTGNPTFSAIYDKSAEFLLNSMNWEDGDVAMDYGCGSGHFASKYLQGMGKSMRIYGVDISPTMVEFAKANYANPNLEFSVGNIMDKGNWTFLPETVDKLVSFLVPCYIQDYKTFMKKVSELMRPGGQVGFLVPFSKANGIPYELFAGEKWGQYEKMETSRIASWVYEIEGGLLDFKSEFESNGFKIKEYQTEHSKFGFESVGQLCELLSVISASASRVPEELRADLMKDLETMAKEHLKITTHSNQPLEVDITFLKIVAEKNPMKCKPIGS